ncbi:MAG: hypothetical protein Q9201_006200 [Fulgogasparrea decipioides]
MLSTTSTPKSILKASSLVPKDAPKAPTNSREEHNRQLALHHARLIQDRKDIEAQVLAATESLLDLPSSLNASPAEPSAADTATVKEGLRLFQPSDYDALVEERNINRRCGYTLCPRENRHQNTNGKYRIIIDKQKDFKFVETKELEKWCSDECARRALYLRVQLNKEPAWTREWKAADPVKLYKERDKREVSMCSHARAASQNPETPVNAESSSTDSANECRMIDLAIERGDMDKTKRVFTKLALRVKESIHETEHSAVPPNMEDNHGGYIEGYMPTGKYVPRQPPAYEEDVEDLIPTI